MKQKAAPEKLTRFLDRHAPEPGPARIRLERILHSVQYAGLATSVLDNQGGLGWRLTTLAAFSPHLTAILVRHPEWISSILLADDLSTPRTADQLSFLMEEGISHVTTPEELQGQLGRFKAMESLRIAARELLLGADVAETGPELSHMASSIIEGTVRWWFSRLFKSGGDRAWEFSWQSDYVEDFCVIGMGKLGGLELNYSSDVDLIYICNSNGGSSGSSGSTAFSGGHSGDNSGGLISMKNPDRPGKLSSQNRGLGWVQGPWSHQLFTKLAQAVTNTLGQVTEEGQLFRVDLRLRPEGRSGPLVNTLESMETYYETWGQAWERAAILRSRPVAGDMSLGLKFEELLEPFVFKRHLDPGALDEVMALAHNAQSSTNMGLHNRSNNNGGVSGACGKRDELIGPGFNLKHGNGGIRQAELVVQAYQLLFGGKRKSLRCKPTMDAARACVVEGFLDPVEGEALCCAYSHLRKLEHRVQMVADMQTHSLPITSQALTALAQSLQQQSGGEDTPPHSQVQRMLSQLTSHTEAVSNLFNKLFGEMLPGIHQNEHHHYRARPSAPRQKNRWEIRSAISDTSSSEKTNQPLSESGLLLPAAGPDGHAPAETVGHQGQPSILLPANISSGRGKTGAELWAELNPAMGNDDHPMVVQLLNEAGFTNSTQASELLTAIYDRPGTPFSPIGRHRYPQLASLILDAILQSPDPDLAIFHMANFTQSLRGREGYYGLLASQENLIRAMTMLFGTSDYLATCITRHPDLLDALAPQSNGAIPRLGRMGVDATLSELLQSIGADAGSGRMGNSNDNGNSSADGYGNRFGLVQDEDILTLLHRFKMEQNLRIGLADVWGALDVPGVESELTHVADACIGVILDLARRHTVRRWIAGNPGGNSLAPNPNGTTPASLKKTATMQPRFSILAMGSFGAGELGYGSDLDMIFIHDGIPISSDKSKEIADHHIQPQRGQVTTAEFSTRLAQRILFYLDCPSVDGPLYRTDTELRPSGRQGTLVSSFPSFSDYHASHSWAFEKLALIRARAMGGDPTLGNKLTAFIKILLERWNPAPETLEKHVKEIMTRIGAEPGITGLDAKNQWDLKRSTGGLLSLTLATQILQVRNWATIPAVRIPGIVESLSILMEQGRLPRELGEPAINAYRLFRSLELRLRIYQNRPDTVLKLGEKNLNRLARRAGVTGSNSGRRLENLVFESREAVQALFHYAVSTSS